MLVLFSCIVVAKMKYDVMVPIDACSIYMHLKLAANVLVHTCM